MGYSEQKYQTRVFSVFVPATSFGTATASGAIASTNVLVMPQFFRKTAVSKIKLRCTVIPNAASTALVASFLNGTNTFATVTLTTATVGQILNATVTASNGTFSADSAPTLNIAGTATASAAANGTWEVCFENQELYA